MRRLVVCADAEAARKLAAALRTRGIAAETRPDQGDAVAVWVVEENDLPAARAEQAAFAADPEAEKFRLPLRDESVAAPRQTDSFITTDAGIPPSWRRLPVTIGLILLCGIAAAWTNLGKNDEAFSHLSIASFRADGDQIGWNGLDDLRSGQVWRLVTPAFVHIGPLHLLFNMLWLWMLGGAIESRRGPVRLLFLVLFTAAASNLAEYFLDAGFDFSRERGLESGFGMTPSPFFGGMSGVVFGLFGFVWMRSRLLPDSGFAMPRDTVVWMLIWLLVCTTGLAGPIANVAHGVGLLVGAAAGAAPRLWRRPKPV